MLRASFNCNGNQERREVIVRQLLLNAEHSFHSNTVGQTVNALKQNHYFSSQFLIDLTKNEKNIDRIMEIIV
ncbi:MAG: hypothetical protein LBU55_01385 [Elusimicrobiota bacterium]|nr:hypothetical protein [Elusimicrobiota bacterium]